VEQSRVRSRLRKLCQSKVIVTMDTGFCDDRAVLFLVGLKTACLERNPFDGFASLCSVVLWILTGRSALTILHK
jgi:hypothetical protein